ncbi:MAG TPA: helix-turn-helix transcriptional regulator [Dehalococcoidia bacterium]|nr:helix-turn-helix transcriptional regulator [Dehalococcoidia bacterium]
MGRGRPPYPDTLTPRQQEVLELVRQGLSNREIGERLGISADGAKFHVSEIITKLGVSTRREAAESYPEGARALLRARPSLRLSRRTPLRRRRGVCRRRGHRRLMWAVAA